MPIVITYKRKSTPQTRRLISFKVKPIRRHKPLGSRAPLDNNFWGDLIRELRIQQRISPRALCIRCGIQPRTLKKYEEGRALPYIDIIERILNELGFELEALSKESISERYRREEMLRNAMASEGARVQLRA